MVLDGFVGADLIHIPTPGQSPPDTVVISYAGHLLPIIENIFL